MSTYLVPAQSHDRPAKSSSHTSAPTSGVAAPVLALLVIAVALWPVLAHVLPADEIINHLARCYVILRHGTDPLLDRFYTIEWKVVPNLAIDLVVPTLASVFGIFLAGKLFVLAYMLLLLTGPHAIHFALYRRLSVGPLVAALFLYNRVDHYGLVNYVFSVGLAMWATALWIALRERPLPRAVAAAACVVVLFLCHLEGLLIYAVAIAGVETQVLWSRRASPRLLARDLAVLLVPFLSALPLLWAGPANDGQALPIHWGGVLSRIDGVLAALESYYRLPDAIAVAAILAGLAWLLWRSVLVVPVAAWAFIMLGGGLFAILPNEAMGAWGAAVRLPIGLLFVLIGLLRWEFPTRRVRLAFLCGLLLIVMLRSAAAEAAFRRYDLIRRDLEASLRLIAPGSRVLAVRTPPSASSVYGLTVIPDLTGLVTIERSSMFSLAFSHPQQQVLVVRPPFRASAGGYNDSPIPLAELLSPSRERPPGGFQFAPSGRIYWADWQQAYDYVYIFDRQDLPSPDGDHLELIYNGDRFQLFRVRRR